MEFSYIQEEMIKNAIAYGKRHDIVIDEDFAAMKLVEEVGEFAQALLIHRKKCRTSKRVDQATSKEELGKELADVVGMAVLAAHVLDIDLEDSIDKKWINNGKVK